ncbi:MAG: bifunctional demethylmenaquinone methyltransferase/2-methoxy-6-polyprenyl-1,4-benzoquinol methylase UbiE, partial [Flavobacteriales bacterium]|nr:bifunctional demethylmenaquinone methyltransferase/2-methoxy-6-polyprenyl-1,4-benzoquinol methylase UbiE [Flavobacteriales bacterium]
MSVKPYLESQDSKKEQVAQMFDNIAHKYDFLNHFFSLGIDILWRKKSIRLLRDYPSDEILDVATGTGDMAFELMKLNPKKIIGVDISVGMLDIGRKKISKRNLDDRMEFLSGDSENLEFENESFDLVTVSFGARNFENLKAGLADMHRVTKKDGKVCVLEFSQPQGFPLKQLYSFYFKRIMPLIGKLVSKDNAAYTYLPESVQA